MIELNVICDKCGETIFTKQITKSITDFIDENSYCINDALTGECLSAPFFTPSMIIDGKHLHYCGKCKKEIKIQLRLGD